MKILKGKIADFWGKVTNTMESSRESFPSEAETRTFREGIPITESMNGTTNSKVQVLQVYVKMVEWKKTLAVEAVNHMVLGKFLINEVRIPMKYFRTMVV